MFQYFCLQYSTEVSQKKNGIFSYQVILTQVVFPLTGKEHGARNIGECLQSGKRGFKFDSTTSQMCDFGPVTFTYFNLHVLKQDEDSNTCIGN